MFVQMPPIRLDGPLLGISRSVLEEEYAEVVFGNLWNKNGIRREHKRLHQILIRRARKYLISELSIVASVIILLQRKAR